MNGTPPRIDAAERLAGLPSLEDSAGKALASTALIVDATMKAWAAYVVANNVPDAQQAKAKRAYEEYQAAMIRSSPPRTVIVAEGSRRNWRCKTPSTQRIASPRLASPLRQKTGAMDFSTLVASKSEVTSSA